MTRRSTRFANFHKPLAGAALVWATLLGGVAGSAAADDALPSILADPATQRANPLPDFSYAGYGFGTETIPTVDQEIDVADFGAKADDGKDDSKAIQAALAEAHSRSGPVRVQFGPGRYILSEILWLEKSGIVLSGMGMGAGGTELYMPRPLNQIDDGGTLDEIRQYLRENDKYERQPDANLDVLFSEYSWSGGFIWSRVPGGRHASYIESMDPPIAKIADIRTGKQFSRTLTVQDTSGLKVGDVLRINWHNRAGPDGPLVKSLYGDTDLKIGSRHWETPDRPLVQQPTRIEAIDGNTVTIADPLLHDIGTDLPAYFSEWAHLSEVGIQDLALVFPPNPYFGHHNESGFNGVYFTGVHNGWIRNVRIENSDSGILTDDLANVTISNVVTQGEHAAHYSVHIGNVHNVLVDRLTVYNPTVHALSFNTKSTRSVYTNSTVWTTPTLDQHAGSNHQNLYDNITVHVTPDQQSEDGKPLYDLYKAGGAGYWQPGHGRFNTTWNLSIVFDGGVAPGDEVVILAGSEGPEARIVGMHGNRPIRLDHRPTPYVEMHNRAVRAVPSLYAYQLLKRTRE
ncbi:right-handed parallel beta-helix repeat-containing protein [Erythrobacter sp. JK5]|uniref:right-handed parallel beta-helix repeat-containing protein n=1 Tax=Erythrobacter sp. JK5 TaxID=2829500 RepID=UPI001BA4EB18|nr:right-handed parallel beta-helix repeat-containing protein [Erythrobacter sp. JK5]QUL38152.1 right-handed parallel beta-helix repeat-containing protein [Erythrobacter sp. JK5]